MGEMCKFEDGVYLAGNGLGNAGFCGNGNIIAHGGGYGIFGDGGGSESTGGGWDVIPNLSPCNDLYRLLRAFADGALARLLFFGVGNKAGGGAVPQYGGDLGGMLCLNAGTWNLAGLYESEAVRRSGREAWRVQKLFAERVVAALKAGAYRGWDCGGGATLLGLTMQTGRPLDAEEDFPEVRKEDNGKARWVIREDVAQWWSDGQGYAPDMQYIFGKVMERVPYVLANAYRPVSWDGDDYGGLAGGTGAVGGLGWAQVYGDALNYKCFMEKGLRNDALSLMAMASAVARVCSAWYRVTGYKMNAYMERREVRQRVEVGYDGVLSFKSVVVGEAEGIAGGRRAWNEERRGVEVDGGSDRWFDCQASGGKCDISLPGEFAAVTVGVAPESEGFVGVGDVVERDIFHPELRRNVRARMRIYGYDVAKGVVYFPSGSFDREGGVHPVCAAYKRYVRIDSAEGIESFGVRDGTMKFGDAVGYGDCGAPAWMDGYVLGATLDEAMEGKPDDRMLGFYQIASFDAQGGGGFDELLNNWPWYPVAGDLSADSLPVVKAVKVSDAAVWSASVRMLYSGIQISEDGGATWGGWVVTPNGKKVWLDGLLDGQYISACGIGSGNGVLYGCERYQSGVNGAGYGAAVLGQVTSMKTLADGGYFEKNRYSGFNGKVRCGADGFGKYAVVCDWSGGEWGYAVEGEDARRMRYERRYGDEVFWLVRYNGRVMDAVKVGE